MPKFSVRRIFFVLAITGVLLTLLTLLAIVGRDQTTLADAVRSEPQHGQPAIISFNRSIRPLLADRCFACHGPDSNKRISGLRLDRQTEAYGPLPKHPDQRAFVAGHPEQSLAYLRISSGDPSQVMPPSTSHLKLNNQEKELIHQWILQGAKWEEHWAFIKPIRPDPPVVANKAWLKNEVDSFILANLEQQGLQPSAPADKATLIRRVSLDITGIPPTPAEVDAFVTDPSPNAYEKVVDRLLASPRYGEQMAITWLDYARYADSHGYQSDPERHMWHWRDWVINAFNANMPFDEFTIEQLAGDLLPNATDEQKLATGFNRNHRINGEGGIIAEEWRVETVVDRVETTSGVFFGLTMGCCRCHDHKFDPITQKEFYQFSGFFNSINEVGIGDTGTLDRGTNLAPTMMYYAPDVKKRVTDLNATIAAAEDKLQHLQTSTPELEQQFVASVAKVSEPQDVLARFALDGKAAGVDAAGKPIPATIAGRGTFAGGRIGTGFKTDGKMAHVDAGDAVHLDRTDAFSYGAWVYFQGEGTVVGRIEDGPTYRGFDLRFDQNKLVTHMIHQYPDDAIKVAIVNPVAMNSWAHLFVTYDGSSKGAGVKLYVDGKLQAAAIEADTLKNTIVTKAPLLIGKRHDTPSMAGIVEDVRFYKRVLSPAEVAKIASRPIVAIIEIPAANRTVEQKKVLDGFLAGSNPETAMANAQINAARNELNGINGSQENTTMIMQELPKPRDTFILKRGQYDQHGDKVDLGLPKVLPPLPAGAPMNRLGLAKWIVDPSNPLTARVQANRLWEKFFGIGLVKTSENFGTQADWPSNPDLLDWLATEMLRLKWDLKAFQKEIVMSAAYQQDSAVTPELLERDPENRLLARGPRYRLPAETVRDQALAVSGLLVEKVGGASVKPYEPANLWADNQFGNLATYMQDKGDSLYRRSIYTFLKRTAAPPNLTAFDMPSREYCIVKRSRTNTPLQALDMMNDPQYLECSRVLAEHMMTDGGTTPAQRIAWGFRRATCRLPSEGELKVLQSGFDTLLAKYQKDAKAADDLLTVGDAPRNKQLNASELAAYSMTASVILNLDEMVTKQ